MISTCRRKQYVEVVATHYIDGGVRPQKIVLATGQVYDVEDSREASRGKVQKSPSQPHLHAVLAPPCRSFSPTFTH